MQTFLPLNDFTASAAVLDRARLGKQRIEAKQLIHAICHGGGWSNHPAARMWRGYVPALAAYGICVCQVWRERGYRDSVQPFFFSYLTEDYDLPPWLGDPAFHASHRSNLLRKAPAHYAQFGWLEPNDLPYVWPV